jgi:hypothetical protein
MPSAPGNEAPACQLRAVFESPEPRFYGADAEPEPLSDRLVRCADSDEPEHGSLGNGRGVMQFQRLYWHGSLPCPLFR